MPQIDPFHIYIDVWFSLFFFFSKLKYSILSAEDNSFFTQAHITHMLGAWHSLASFKPRSRPVAVGKPIKGKAVVTSFQSQSNLAIQ